MVDNPEMDRAVADYTAGMGRFLGLNKNQMRALGERYRRGLTNFADSLSAQAAMESITPLSVAQRRKK